MPRLRVHNVAMSIDGCCAGPDQSVDDPLGVGAEQLHEWMFETRTWRAITNQDGGATGVADDFMRAGIDGIGATVMGRNMFGPVRGSWGDSDWRGWWDEDPPYHHPVFVLTHHGHDPIPMEGGTTFHFVTDGIESALQQAFDAAGGADVRLGGGVSTVQQYLRAGLVDDLHVPVVPILLGGGERLFADPSVLDRYECVEVVSTPGVAHFRFAKSAS